MAEATIKDVATQKFQAEKESMQEWKQVVMEEVTRELYAIRHMHKGAIEAQKQNFQLELKCMRGKVE